MHWYAFQSFFSAVEEEKSGFSGRRAKKILRRCRGYVEKSRPPLSNFNLSKFRVI